MVTHDLTRCKKHTTIELQTYSILYIFIFLQQVENEVTSLPRYQCEGSPK